MKNQTVSKIAFLGALGAIALIVFKQVSVAHGLMIGGGLLAIGFVTQPSSPSV